jgi:hypothetical protein
VDEIADGDAPPVQKAEPAKPAPRIYRAHAVVKSNVVRPAIGSKKPAKKSR